MKFIRNQPKRNYPTNKTDVFYTGDIWSLYILDLKIYGPENNRGYRYVLVIIDKFINFGWSIPLKFENGQSIKDCSGSIIMSSKREPT